MASLDDAIELVNSFPEVTEGTRWGNRTWLVGGKGFAWERPLNKADLKRLGDEPAPEGPLLATRTEDMADKAAVLEAGVDGIFDIAHFAKYPAVLIELDVISSQALHDAVEDAWLAMAPRKLVDAYLAAHSED